MKVLHVIPSISGSLGGPTQVVLNIVKFLREVGVDAEVATTNDNGSSEFAVALNQRIDFQGIPVWFFKRSWFRNREFICSAPLWQWLKENIKNYDVLDLHYLFSFSTVAAAKHARKQEVPYTIRTMGQLAPWALAQSKLKKQIYSFFIEQRNLNCAAAVHCTSNGEAEDVSRFGVKSPLVTLPLGVISPQVVDDAKTLLHQVLQIPPDRTTILYLSRLHYKKQPELLLELTAEYLQQGLDCHLIFAGDGNESYVSGLKRRAYALKVQSNVSFPGFIEGEVKNLFLQGSDIFALPSHSENFGIAVAEALSSGLPVVITKGIQIGEDLARGEAALVVENNRIAISSAITDLLTSPKKREQLGLRAKEFAAEHYSWIKICQNLAKVYENIINHGSPLSSQLNEIESRELLEYSPSI